MHMKSHIKSQNKSCGIQQISVHVLATLQVRIITLLTGWDGVSNSHSKYSRPNF